MNYLVLGIAGATLGAAGLVYSLWMAFESVAATRWPSAPGHILTAKRERTGNRWIRYSPRVTYSYEVMGTTYTGSRISFGGDSTSFEDVAEDEVKRYSSGRAITVRYHPSKPARSVLEAGWPLSPILWTGFFALVLVGSLSSLGLL